MTGQPDPKFTWLYLCLHKLASWYEGVRMPRLLHGIRGIPGTGAARSSWGTWWVSKAEISRMVLSLHSAGPASHQVHVGFKGRKTRVSSSVKGVTMNLFDMTQVFLLYSYQCYHPSFIFFASGLKKLSHQLHSRPGWLHLSPRGHFSHLTKWTGNGKVNEIHVLFIFIKKDTWYRYSLE